MIMTEQELPLISDEIISILGRKGFYVNDKTKQNIEKFFSYYTLSTDERFELGIRSLKHIPWQSIHYWSECVKSDLCPVGLDNDDLGVLCIGENNKLYRCQGSL